MKVDEKYYQNLWAKNRLFKQVTEFSKEKRFVFTSPISFSHFDFDIENVSNYLRPDIIHRYYLMKGYDVLSKLCINSLSPKILESKSFDFFNLDHEIRDTISNYVTEMQNFSIAFDQSEVINTYDKDFITYVQKEFQMLYDKGFIKYGKRNIYLEASTNKYLDDTEIIKINNNVYSIATDELAIKKNEEVFYLDLSSIEDELIDLIMDNSNEWFSTNLKTLLGYKEGYIIDFFDPIEEKIVKVNTITIEGIYGVAFISISSNNPNVYRYINEVDLIAFEEYLHSKEEVFFTNYYLTNPITLEDIPILVFKDNFPNMLLGIPSLSQKAMKIATKYGIKFCDVVENDFMINSGTMNGYSIKAARKMAKEEFIKKEIIEMIPLITKKEFIISSNSKWGIYVPFMNIDGLKKVDSLPILSNNLMVPYSKDLNINSALFTKTISKSFVFPFIIYANLNNSKLEFGDVCDNGQINYDYVAPISIYKTEIKKVICAKILEIIMEKINKPVPIISLHDIIFAPTLVDEFSKRLSKKNNNLISLKSLENISPDALRLYFISKNTEDFAYNAEELAHFENRIDDYILIFDWINDHDNLTKEFNLFVNKVSDYLDDYDFFNYYICLEEMLNKIKLSKAITKEHAITFLKVMSLVMPTTSDYIYYEILNRHSFLVFEEWPNNNNI